MKFEQILKRKSLKNPFYNTRSKVDFLYGMLLYSIFFPYVPGLFPTDTQPTFAVFFAFAILYLLFHKKHQNLLFDWNWGRIIVFLSIIAYSIFAIEMAKAHIPGKMYVGKYFGFIQFLLAIFFGVLIRREFSKKVLTNILIVYGIFTVVYYVTNGMVESVLIISRSAIVDQMLRNQGRGARTLAAEPSFFAIHMFNLFVVYIISFGWRFESKKENYFFLGIIACMMSSLSGFGFLLSLVMIGLRYLRFSIIAFTLFVLGLIVFNQEIIALVESYSGIRFVDAVSVLITNPELILQGQGDNSALVRINSLILYIMRFVQYPIFGDGFTIKAMGGFFSVVAYMGILALLIYFLTIIEILILKKSNLKTKLVILIWFLFNSISGSIGVPLFGIIIGMIYRHNHILGKSSPQELSD